MCLNFLRIYLRLLLDIWGNLCLTSQLISQIYDLYLIAILIVFLLTLLQNRSYNLVLILEVTI